MIITISGDIGSGKTTVGKLVAELLHYKYLSTGFIQRNIAQEMGLSTLELNILSEKQSEIDDKIDSYTMALNDSDKDHIVDSRLAWHFIPASFKVYLSCKIEIAAERISRGKKRRSEKKQEKVSDTLARIIDRRASEKRRFLQKYGINYTDLSNYDFIIDTSNLQPVEVGDEIIRHFDLWKGFVLWGNASGTLSSGSTGSLK